VLRRGRGRARCGGAELLCPIRIRATTARSMAPPDVSGHHDGRFPVWMTDAGAPVKAPRTASPAPPAGHRHRTYDVGHLRRELTARGVSRSVRLRSPPTRGALSRDATALAAVMAGHTAATGRSKRVKAARMMAARAQARARARSRRPCSTLGLGGNFKLGKRKGRGERRRSGALYRTRTMSL
jgi:hypothetical protein